MTENPTSRNVQPRAVVVGLDDSAAGQEALAWAARYARQTGQPLHALHVLEFGGVAGFPLDANLGGPGAAAPGFGPPGPLAVAPATPGPAAAPVTADPASTTGPRMPESIQQAFDAIDPEPSWTLELGTGVEAGTALVERSTNAALLVIGTGVHTGLGRLAHGSVSHYCLSHTTIPVVAVPTTPAA